MSHMRVLLLAALALGGCGLGFDGDEPPTTLEACAKAGGALVIKDGWWVCETGPDLAYAAAKGAKVTAGDAGAHD